MLIFLPQLAPAETGTFTGIVLDAETKEPIANAQVQVTEGNIKIATSDDGMFEINDFEEGIYEIDVTRIGYLSNHLEFEFNNGNRRTFVIYLIPKAIEMSPVVVTSQHTHSRFEELDDFSHSLRGKDLQKEMGLTLASTLKNETGLAIRSMGPAPARPVVRGLSGDRVVISEDGYKTIDLSATSPDHAVTIEPFSLEKIEVIRGPKVLLKSSSTFGGVVNAVRHEIPMDMHKEIYGSVGAYGETANEGYLGSLSLEVPFDQMLVKTELTRKSSSDLHTPIGRLQNSETENLDFSIGGNYFTDFGFAGYSYRQFELDYGIPGGFIGAHPNGVDIEMIRRQHNAKSRINIGSDRFESVELHFSNAYYRHKEFESNGLIGTEFKIINYSGNVDLNHEQIGPFGYGIFGITFDHRDFDIGGYVFNPPTVSTNVSLYIYENFTHDKLSLEFGGRINYDRITPEYEKPDANIGHIRERTFGTYSLSFSAIYRLSKVIHSGINVSRSSRVPTIEELFSEGPHLAAYSYEVGNPDLDDEHGIGAELFFFHETGRFDYSITFFNNEIENYIIPRNTGRINYSTLLPIYASEGVSARLRGVEAQAEAKLTGNLSFLSSVSYTRGDFKETGEPLPQIPPLKGLSEIKYSTPNYSVGFSAQYADNQERVDTFEEPTDGYLVYNAYAQYFLTHGQWIHSISLSFDNIFDKEYRNHLSRVKSIMPEAGRNFKVTYKVFFGI
ncbi:MAG: TonB-dependent receptor [candidate division Zixibacteria bacterium]|nr:TonB-dependent receptor [candidate division Zixibacteria bacterium]